MSDKITHISLVYDTEKKNVAQGPKEDIDRNPVVRHLELPSLIKMDPQLMRKVMKPAAFEARQELERRMKAFDEQWARHTHSADAAQKDAKDLRQQPKTKPRR